MNEFFSVDLLEKSFSRRWGTQAEAKKRFETGGVKFDVLVEESYQGGRLVAFKLFENLCDARVSYGISLFKNGKRTDIVPITEELGTGSSSQPREQQTSFRAVITKFNSMVKQRKDLLTEEKKRLDNCVARVPYPNPADSHLEYVLCVWKREDGIPVEWVVWSHNKQDHGFYFGRYCRDLAAAVAYFNEVTNHCPPFQEDDGSDPLEGNQG